MGLRLRRIPLGVATLTVLATLAAPLATSAVVADDAPAPLVQVIDLDALLEPDSQEQTVADLLELAADTIEFLDPDAIANVWLDPITGLLTAGVTTTSVIDDVEDLLGDAGIDDPEVVLVDNSQALLDAVASQVRAVTTGPLADVNSIIHDYAHNRLVLTTASGPTTELRETLYSLFGNAVVVGDQPFDARLTADSRQADSGSFYAGAWIGFLGIGPTCTLGFSWVTPSGAPRMLTAGHCFPKDGLDGSVATNARSPYKYWVGHQIGSTFDKDGTIGSDGDLSLIDLTETDLNSPLSGQGAPRMWSGGASSTTSTTVNSVDKWTSKGDKVCYSGMRRGVQCGGLDSDGNGGYTVEDPDYEFKDDKTKAWVTHVALATKGWGKCAQPGDSGSPVYINTAGAGVAAHGILSGSGGGGDDQYVGRYEPSRCMIMFTEIGQAYEHWRGHVEVN